jgi:hypothetical protein
MNKLSVFATLAALLACAGSIFATLEMRRVSTSLASLEDRFASLERSTGIPTQAADPSKPGATEAPKSPATMAEVASEVVRLKKELSEVKSAQEAAVASEHAVAATKTDKPPAPLAVGSQEEVAKVVEQVLAAKEEAQKKEEAKQADERNARRVTDMMNTLTEQLGLTEQQKTQVTVLVSKEFAAMRELWSNRKEGEDIRPKIDEVRKDGETQIKAVLSSEQQTKFDDVVKQMGGGFGRGRGGPGGGN